MTHENPSAPRPLSGVRVLDLTRVLAGPFCTMVLADLGAEVVKVERPGTGDDARHFGPFLKSGRSGYFASINRGKKSIALDLKNDADRETFLKLAGRAHVLVENFRPGTMESLGIGPERLRRINPNLVYASASGFGRHGLYGRRPAYDIIVQAMSGLMSVTGPDGGQPVRVGASISDILTGLFTAVGILAALRVQARDGAGADLDMAMLDCTVAALENALTRYEATGTAPRPLGTRHPSITPFQAFDTQDNPIVIAAGNDELWRKLCETLDAPELVDDPRFKTNPDRTGNHAELEEELLLRLHTMSSAEWLERLEGAGVPCAPVRDMSEVAADAHLDMRGMLHRMQDGESGDFLTAGSPLRMNGESPPLSPHAPELGEHTESVLKEWLS